MFRMFGRRAAEGADGDGGGVDVVLVGHCGADNIGLSRVVKRHLPGANIVTARRWSELEPYCRPGAVLLVNRVLDGSSETDRGVELIRRVVQMDEPLTAMLISNHEQAQREAEAAGARPGFGKAEQQSDAARQRLRDAAEAATQAGSSEPS